MTTENTSSDTPPTVLLHGARLNAKELAPDVRAASQLKVGRGLFAIAFDWALIVGSLAASISFPNPAVWLVSAIVIAGRQHALLVLMHEATHYRIVRNRALNDRISNWFLAWPLTVTTEGFRSDHLPHHFHLFSEKDPEWTRKRVRPEFQFPMSQRHFFSLIIKDSLGFSVLKMFRLLLNFSGAQQEQKPVSGKQKLLNRLERTAYYGVIVGTLAYFNVLLPVLAMWFIPAFTLLFAILRIRNVSEHSNVGMSHDLEMSRNVVRPTWLERLVLSPHEVGLHLVHHLYPSVPFYNLRTVHNRLMELDDYSKESLQVDRYFSWSRSSVITDITAPRANETAYLNGNGARLESSNDEELAIFREIGELRDQIAFVDQETADELEPATTP